MYSNQDTSASAQDVLRVVQALEQKSRSRSRFRRLARHLEPVVDFLTMYSPAVDMLVQFDVNPSAVVWGSIKTLIKIAQNSIKYYTFIEPMLERCAAILSTSTRYEKMFEQDLRVQKALVNLYGEVSDFLQRLRRMLSSGSVRVVFNSVFRSVDVAYHESLQRLSWTNEVFKEEVTIVHRKHLEDHITEQHSSSLAIDRIASQWEQSQIQIRESEQTAQKALELRRSVMIWLGRVELSDTLHRAMKKRSPNTGLWLFDEPNFQQWIHSSDSDYTRRMLWIQGAPGIGKTVLSASTIEHIQLHESCSRGGCRVVYFYGDYSKSYDITAYTLCVSILSQLLGSLLDLPNVVLESYENAKRHGRVKVSQEDDVFELFREVAAALPSMFLIIDALDEVNDVDDTLSWLEDAVRSIPTLRLVCFSRHTAAIRKRLGQYPSIRIDASSSKQDIDQYLTSAVSTLPCEDPDLERRIFRTISRKAQGMFLFADLSIRMLRSAIDVDNVLCILDEVPGGINEMYAIILQRLTHESIARQSLTRKVFRLLCTSIRPLTWKELRSALSWDAESQTFIKSKESFKETVLELCCPLIEYQTDTQTFMLVHFSFREFLCKDSSPSLPTQDNYSFAVLANQAQSELAEMTIASLMHHRGTVLMDFTNDSHPMLSYAVKYWCYHLSQSPFTEALYEKYANFRRCSYMCQGWILCWLLSEEHSFPLQEIIKLHKAVEEWAAKGGATQSSRRNILREIQSVLFCSHTTQSTSMPEASHMKPRAISNFEKLMCVRDLAREYTMAGKLDEGIAAFEKQIQDVELADEKILSTTCWLLNGLGILYDQQGSTHRAQEVRLRALELQERLLPPDHLDVILTINELGRIARHLGNHQEAESYHRKALKILQSIFAENDLHITWTRSALGRSLLKQGRPDEAMSQHQQVLAIETSRLGRNHPHTLWTLSDIARCHRDQGRIEDAIATQEEVLKGNRNALGVDNPDTLWASNSLGILYETAGQRDNAKTLHTRALEGQEKALGSGHPHTVWSRERLKYLVE